MERDRADENADRMSASAKQGRQIRLARMTRNAAIVILVLSALLIVGSIVASWLLNFGTDSTFGSGPNTPFRYKISNFLQNLSYTVALPLISAVGSIWLLVHSAQMQAVAEEVANRSEEHSRTDEVLVVDIAHPVVPVLPRQGSVDDSMWKPPDFEPADNPWQRS
jgi:hypothetical protein